MKQYPTVWKEHIKLLLRTPLENLVQFVVVGADRVCTEPLSGAPCMYLLGRTGAMQPEVVICKLARTFKGVQPMRYKATRNYLDWLLTESPFSDFYVTKSVAEVRKTGVCIVRCDIPANLMLAALVAFRHVWEFPSFIQAWQKLVERGVDKAHALVLSQWCSADAKGVVCFSGGRHNSNHFIFGYTCPATTLQTFKNADWPIEEANYSEVVKYEGLQYTWGEWHHTNNLHSAMVNHLTFTTVVGGFGSQSRMLKQPYKQIAKALNLVLEELQ